MRIFRKPGTSTKERNIWLFICRFILSFKCHRKSHLIEINFLHFFLLVRSLNPAESKLNQLNVKSEIESTDATDVNQFTLQNQQGFMVRSGSQSYRFQGPQNFIHQQPPPMTQTQQFSGHRGQIMSNSSMNLYQNVGQTQMMQPPPQTTSTHQFIQQDMNVFQQSNNFNQNNQQANMNRFNGPQQQQQHQPGSDGMMTGNYQQQPRFRQW